jgi:hypothetical protein
MTSHEMADTQQSALTRRSFMRLAAGSAAAAAALVVISPGVDAKDARVERRISLAATSAGRKLGASGHARFRVRGSRQDFKVEAEGRIKSGTRLSVYVTNGGVTVKAGTIRISSVGEGELELKNYDGLRLPGGVAPVNKISKVSVNDANGTTILSGSF